MSNSHIFRYPEELKADFVKTKGLDFKNGKHVSAAEIWEFMTVEAPQRFPNAFDRSRRYHGRLSNDVTFFTGIKLGYMGLSFRDRLLEAHAAGTPIIHVAGGQTVDPYFAAGGIPIVPGPLRGWARDMKEGLSLREADQRANEILEAGRQAVSIDACNNPIGSISAISAGIVPVDLIAPYLNLRCTDIGFSIEAFRNNFNGIPFTLVDYPITQDKESAVAYFADQLRRVVKQIGDIRGKQATNEELWNEIKLENRGRRFAREVTELVWSAELPPVQSANFGNLITTGRFSSGDSLAATQLLEQAIVEIGERIKNSVVAHGVDPNPVRLLSSGSCFGLNGDFVEAKGGIIVGTDDHLSKIYADVDENGSDPYLNLARAALTYSYEKPAEERARYVVDLVRKSRADGVVCGFNWGCNYQSATSRLVADIVKKETGVPTINIEVAELGRTEATEQTQNRIESFIEVLKNAKAKKAA